MNRGRRPNHWCTGPRRAVLTRDWPGGVAVGVIMDVLADLPGPPVPDQTVVTGYATTVMRLRRPPGYLSAVKTEYHARRRAA